MSKKGILFDRNTGVYSTILNEQILIGKNEIASIENGVAFASLFSINNSLQ